ncbi:uncharacterized protein CLUP02_12667 [Colletotrichum lupini]|uniref:Uncharacterized protein n=1 Tax=Colletotrichum lupini TaxID=145971 RepID=A0A9Q8T0Y3_9PEZI|nr:uncharacterized protein CLUP02_12667 [Colletotrichum lupini]UQC87166.1 hypothetical protein CLUP02_12667 [Colletotrichum lupini]
MGYARRLHPEAERFPTDGLLFAGSAGPERVIPIRPIFWGKRLSDIDVHDALANPLHAMPQMIVPLSPPY